MQRAFFGWVAQQHHEPLGPRGHGSLIPLTGTATELERGTFTFPARMTESAKSIVIDVHELAMLLEGIELERGTTKRRWEPTRAVVAN